jgi:phage FluMu gp28-like protein
MAAINLLPYQKKWLQDKSRFKIGMFSRQTGKTFTNCLEIVDDCLEAEASSRRKRWVILSRGERQSKEAIEVVKHFLNAYRIAFEASNHEFSAAYTALEIRLPGGSVITALPASPDTSRGFSASVLLDEFAFHQDSRKIWQALFPVISAGHSLRVVSTPNGKGNKFYELMTDEDTPWSRHVVDIYQAVAQGLDRNIDELRKAIADPDSWSQEFELQWLDEASAWLSFELIASRESSTCSLDGSQYRGGDVYIGNDVGLRGDLWVAWALEDVGTHFNTIEVATLRRSTFAQHDEVIDRMFSQYKVRRFCGDQTGMGERTIEEYKRRYGSRAEGVLFTIANKQALAMLGKSCFEDGRVSVPSDQEIRNDLHKLKKVTSATGSIRFDASRDSQGHADRTWALFLACNAAVTPSCPIEYQSEKRLEMEEASDYFAGTETSLRGW